MVKTNRLPRKLKKRVINCFGRGTYRGLMEGYLRLEKYVRNNGVITRRTTKSFVDNYYMPHQYNPYINFPNINQYDNNPSKS